MSRLPLEDNAADVIAKAQRGLKLGDEELARRAGIDRETVAALKSARFSEAAVRAVAVPLGLRAEALIKLSRNAWHPEEPAFLDGFAMATTPYGDMTVNAYLVWDPASRAAAVFDTGANAQALLKIVRENALRLRALFLTHTHEDHVAEVGAFQAEGVDVHVSEREPFPGARGFAEGARFRIGALSLRTLSTWGHSPGGATYVVEGLSRPLAVVGDSLFAGSMGGSAAAYEMALQNNREKFSHFRPRRRWLAVMGRSLPSLRNASTTRFSSSDFHHARDPCFCRSRPNGSRHGSPPQGTRPHGRRRP